MFMFQRLEDKKGITLVEMVISVLILAMALGAMLGCFVIGRISATKAKHRVQAMNFLRGKMEEIKAIGIDESSGSYTLEEGLTGTWIVNVDPKDGYKEIEVVISWQDPIWGGTKEVSEELVTLISE